MTPVLRQILLSPVVHPAGAVFVDKTSGTLGSSGTIALPAAAVSGNLCVIALQDSSGHTGQALTTAGSGGPIGTVGAGITTTPSAFFFQLFALVLNGADVSGARLLTLANGGLNNEISISCYSGATTVAQTEYVRQASRTDTLTFTGLTPSGSSKGFVSMMVAEGGSPNNVITPPSGWTMRLNNQADGVWAPVISDQLSGYMNASIIFSGYTVTGNDVCGVLLEMT